MSSQVIAESNVKHILRMSPEEMRKIIKTEAKIEKFLKDKVSYSRRAEIE